MLLRFLPAGPRQSWVDPLRRRDSETPQARGAAGEFLGAHPWQAGSGHADPRAPGHRRPLSTSARLPWFAAGVERHSRRQREVSVAAAYARGSHLRAGKRRRRLPSPRPPPHPRPPREAGAARRQARSGCRSNFICAKASGVNRKLPPRGARMTGLFGGLDAGGWVGGWGNLGAARGGSRAPAARALMLKAASLGEDQTPLSRRVLLLTLLQLS